MNGEWKKGKQIKHEIDCCILFHIDTESNTRMHTVINYVTLRHKNKNENRKKIKKTQIEAKHRTEENKNRIKTT